MICLPFVFPLFLSSINYSINRGQCNTSTGKKGVSIEKEQVTNICISQSIHISSHFLHSNSLSLLNLSFFCVFPS